MEDWDTFEVVKYMCNWDAVGEDEEEGGEPESLYYEDQDGENLEATIEEARELVEQGVITPETKVWADNLDDWTPFAEAAESLGLGDATAEQEGASEPAEEEGVPPQEDAATSAAEAPAEPARPRKPTIPKGSSKSVKLGGSKKPVNHSSVAGMSNKEQAEYFLKKFNRHE